MEYATLSMGPIYVRGSAGTYTDGDQEVMIVGDFDTTKHLFESILKEETRANMHRLPASDAMLRQLIPDNTVVMMRSEDFNRIAAKYQQMQDGGTGELTRLRNQLQELQRMHDTAQNECTSLRIAVQRLTTHAQTSKQEQARTNKNLQQERANRARWEARAQEAQQALQTLQKEIQREQQASQKAAAELAALNCHYTETRKRARHLEQRLTEAERQRTDAWGQCNEAHCKVQHLSERIQCLGGRLQVLEKECTRLNNDLEATWNVNSELKAEIVLLKEDAIKQLYGEETLFLLDAAS